MPEPGDPCVASQFLYEPLRARPQTATIGRVIHLLSLPPGQHDSSAAQQTQVIGDGRLRQLEAGHDLADVHLSSPQQLQNGLTGLVGQGLDIVLVSATGDLIPRIDHHPPRFTQERFHGWSSRVTLTSFTPATAAAAWRIGIFPPL